MLDRKSYTREDRPRQRRDRRAGAINVIELVPEQAVVKLKVGDPIRLTEEELERVADALFAELERT